MIAHRHGSALSALPAPDGEAARCSKLLTARICAAIEERGGWIGFDEYMQRALNEPGLGYYSAGGTKIGPAGDFITSAELGSFLGRALAGQIACVLEPLAEPVVAEIGAGTGRLARAILEALDRRGVACEYRILETSADLRQRQRSELECFGKRVSWLDRWPGAPFEGLVLANEVLDALAVTCFIKQRRGVRPLGVSRCADGFIWAEGPEQVALTRAVEQLERQLGRELEAGFRSEIRLGLPQWIESAAAPVRKGALLFIDYGMVRADYYARERNGGTLICHYRHRAHTDPFLYPGLQDLSAWVDFSACADTARGAGLDIAGFTTQAHFLTESGLLEELTDAPATRAEALEREHLKKLLLPGEMGEHFKVMMLTKGGVPAALPGRDFRDRL